MNSRPCSWRRWSGSTIPIAFPTSPELYDLAADLAETSDLAAREPERVSAMMARLRAYQAEVEAEGPSWPAAERRGRPPKPARAATN